MDLDKVICYCQNITNGMIKEAACGGAGIIFMDRAVNSLFYDLLFTAL